MISVIIPTKRPSFYENIAENLSRQDLKPDTMVIITPKASSFPLSDFMVKIDGNIILLEDGTTKSSGGLYLMGLLAAAELSDNGFMCTWEDDDWYGSGFISETQMAFKKHPDAGIIGKCHHWIKIFGPKEESFIDTGNRKIGPDGRVDWVAGGSMAIDVKTWKQYPSFRCKKTDWTPDAYLLMSANSLGIPIYTTGTENFLYQRFPQRHGFNHGHVWDMPGA